MIISEQYELGQLAGSDFQTFHARELATGRLVMVHLLTGAGLNLEEFRALEADLNTEGQAQLLGRGEFEGNPYVVTLPLAGFTTLREWLNSSPKAVASVPPKNSSVDLGFTQMFGASGARPAASPAPPAADPGDDFSFTRVFQQPAPAAAPSQPVQVIPPVPPAAPRPSQAARDSVSELFRPPAASTPPQASAPSADLPDPNTLTQFFRTPGDSARQPPYLSLPPRVLPPSGTDDFTKFFKHAEDPLSPDPRPLQPRPPSPSLPPAPPPVQGVPGDGATQIFRGPLTPGVSDLPFIPASVGPSDFTRITGARTAAPVSAGVPGTPPSPSWSSPPAPALPIPPVFPAAPSPPAPPANANLNSILIGVLSCVVTLGFLAILYLLFLSGPRR